MSLRKSYDALVWQDADELKTGRDKLLSLRTFTMKAMRIAAIFVLAFGLSYILIQTLQKENVEMQTVYVPAGQRTQVTLADGTMVWVNGKSTLTFPSQFASRTRKVELDGEAPISKFRKTRRNSSLFPQPISLRLKCWAQSSM